MCKIRTSLQLIQHRLHTILTTFFFHSEAGEGQGPCYGSVTVLQRDPALGNNLICELHHPIETVIQQKRETTTTRPNALIEYLNKNMSKCNFTEAMVYDYQKEDLLPEEEQELLFAYATAPKKLAEKRKQRADKLEKMKNLLEETYEKLEYSADIFVLYINPYASGNWQHVTETETIKAQ